jgi:hypothetical protein
MKSYLKKKRPKHKWKYKETLSYGEHLYECTVCLFCKIESFGEHTPPKFISGNTKCHNKINILVKEYFDLPRIYSNEKLS